MIDKNLPKNPFSKCSILNSPKEAARLAYDQAQQDMLLAGYRLPNYWDNHPRTGEV